MSRLHLPHAVVLGCVLGLVSAPASAQVVDAGVPSEPAASATETPVAEAPVPEAPVPDAPDETDAPPAHDWLDDLSIRVFVDAYVASHWTLPSGFQGDHSAQLPQRVYDVQGGPTVSLMAIDLSYAPQPIGATLGIRFGTGEPRWLGNFSGLPQGLQFLQQAYVSWRPVEQFQIDFGEFTTPYGAEYGETWLNVTYTLGALFNLVQPFYHAGFRGVWTPVNWLAVTALAVNGYNDIVDNNDGKTGGLQLTMTFSPITITVGYLGGPEQAPVAGVSGVDGRMRHLVDAIVSLQLDHLRLELNGDYRTEDMGGTWSSLFNPTPAMPDQVSAPGTPQYQTLWGMSLGANYRFVPEFGLGARVEYIGQPDIAVSRGRDLVTSTFTIDWLPIRHLVIRLDNRIDWLSAPLFADHTGTGAMQFVASSVLGIVVHSD